VRLAGLLYIAYACLMHVCVCPVVPDMIPLTICRCCFSRPPFLPVLQAQEACNLCVVYSTSIGQMLHDSA